MAAEFQLDQVDVRLGGHVVVHDVSASLAPGKLHVIVGPNGAGKSTLLKAAAALLPLNGGAIKLDGADVDRGVFSLSGGQRARVLLARVMCSRADIFLLDEPLIALDPAWQRQVLLRLKARAAAGATVIASLHDLHLTAQFADEVLLMHQGKLIKKGSPDQVFTRSLLKDVFSLMGELVREDGKPVLKIDNTPMLYQPV